LLSDQTQFPRVALFTDTFFEPNGVATLSRQFADFAQSRSLPFLVVRGSRETSFACDGSLQTQQCKRGAAAFAVDKDLYFDPLFMRHKQLVLERMADFKPDLIHITGPGDLGFLGLSVSHFLRIPLVASWHTNLHEYLAKRLDLALQLLPQSVRGRSAYLVERHSLRGLLRFYRTAQFTLAPNQTLVDMIHSSTRRPSFLMDHGVDLRSFKPVPRLRNSDRPFCIGYVGRLTTEKNVRLFADIETQLIAAGEENFKFLIVGDGGQQKWLERHVQNAELPGVLRGEQLAAAYNQMDAFVFPSRTDTFGLVILEAMATGVPVILAPETGRRIGIQDGVSGFLSEDFAASLQLLMHDPERLDSMRRAARIFANTNSWDHVFEGLYETYIKGLSIADLRRAQREALV
jgi:glycosyltransferase involved in cell wall biosynthesis